MRFDDLYIAGVAHHLPAAMPTDVAVARDLIDARTAHRTGLRSVCVSEDSGPELAVHAARKALDMACAGPDDIGLVLHAASYFQGHDLWVPASYVQDRVLGNDCLSLVVNQLSNGGMAALDLSLSYLQADRGRRGALITTGDRFCLPGVDRWRTDPGTVFGDGGTAMVLSTSDGFAQVLSMVTVSDSSLESMGRGGGGFAPVSPAASGPLSIEEHRAQLVDEIGLSELIDRLYRGQQKAFEMALAEADLDAKDISRFVVPHLGHPKMKLQFFSCLDLEPGSTTWNWGAGVGHLGAGDQFAGLAHLVQSGDLVPGEYYMLLGSGGGFSWSAAVIEAVTPA